MIKKESAGGIILNEYQELVMVFTDTNSWQFPKGTVEKGEKYYETALREIEEETGLKDLKFIEKLPMYTRICRDQKSFRDIHYFLFYTSKQSLIPSAEISQAEWIDIEKAENKLTYPKDKEFFSKIKEKVVFQSKNTFIKKSHISPHK